MDPGVVRSIVVGGQLVPSKSVLSQFMTPEAAAPVGTVLHAGAAHGFGRRMVGTGIVVCLSMIASGCDRRASLPAEKLPRPVTTFTLRASAPPAGYSLSGAVKSWKTEEIGFEIPGRVQWVLEPDRNIDGRIVDPDQVTVLIPGTPLAQIDPARYRVAVESARANLEVARLDREAQEIQLNLALPADKKSALADLELARSDFARLEQLRTQNTITQAQFEEGRSRVEIQEARLDSLDSSQKQLVAQLSAAAARIKAAEQTLRDAERDLENCTLYAPYRGQIAAVHVVPGSVVAASSPVLTVQMMDPIRIDVELSADQSRQVRRQRQVPVTYARPNGQRVSEPAFVYTVDPSADPTTRTFTLTLLLRNERMRMEPPEDIDPQRTARSEDMWPLSLGELMGDFGSAILVEDRAIRTDGQDHYVWYVTNAQVKSPLPTLLSVEKRYVRPMPLRIPFLGNWTFQHVEFLEPDSVTAEGLVVGEIKWETPDGEPAEADAWQGDTVYLDPGDPWMLRPGDLVSVNLADGRATAPAFYVPVTAIYEESGSHSLFVARADGTAQRLPVRTRDPLRLDRDSLIEVEPVDASTELNGLAVILEGAHFLKDGDRVQVVASQDAEISRR